MAKKSIKIIIAGRSYPLTIKEEEEDVVRRAVDDINGNIQRLQESYAVKDMQDLLAMTSLQLATRKNSKTETTTENNDLIQQKEVLSALQKLSESIEK